MKRLNICIVVIALCLTAGVIFLCLAATAGAESVRTTTWITLKWDPVVENSDETACDDLDGYAIYRSRVNDDDNAWSDLTGREKAYKIIPADQNKASFWCYEPGTWFFIVRAFDTSNNFSGTSNIVECFVDTAAPGVVTGVEVVTPGDLNNDGKVDGADLSIMSQNIGK